MVNVVMDKGACTTQKICFKVFCNEQKAKMQMKYPFLKKSQINQKIKERWKKMDTAEKMCYTKTVLSPPKFKRNGQLNNPQTGKVAQKSNRNKGTRGKSPAVRANVGNDVFSVLKQNQTERRTEMNKMSCTDSQIEHRTEKRKVSHTDDLKDDVNANSESTIKMLGRKTVPWKGRPTEGKTGLWSDSSSPDRNYGEKTKITKKKNVQGILKPNGDTPTRHRAENRVSFGNLPSAISSPANFGDCNAGDSDDNDSVQLLHRTDEDMYDFEKIARYDLCVEEDNYARPNQQSLKEGIQQTDEKITGCKKRVTKGKLTEGEKTQDGTVEGKLLSPLTDGLSQYITSPLEKEIAPQMDRYVTQQKLTEGKKACSLKASSTTEPARGSKRRHRGLGNRIKSDDKQTPESDSLTESFPESDSIASQDRLERNMHLLSEKLFNLENTSKAFSNETDDSTVESQSSVKEICNSANMFRDSTLLPQRKRKNVQNDMKNKILKDFSSNSDSGFNLKSKSKKKSGESPELQKNTATLTSTLSTLGKDRKSKRTKQAIDEKSSLQQSKESKKLKSPQRRMDADILISESPPKMMNFERNFYTEGPSLYFNDNSSNDSDNSSTEVDREQTNKVLVSAILRMQRAVQYEGTSDAGTSSPSLSGISQLSYMASCEDSTSDSTEMVKDVCTEAEIQYVQSITDIFDVEQSATDNTNSQETANCQNQIPIPKSAPSQMENEDQDCKELEIMNVPHNHEKEMFFPASSTKTLSDMPSCEDSSSDSTIHDEEMVKDVCTEAEIQDVQSITDISDVEQSATDNTNSQGTANCQNQIPIPKSAPSQLENEDQDCKEIMDVPHNHEKEMCFPASSTKTKDFGGGDEDVFQMFSKISPSKAKSIQGKRFITSSRYEGRSNFTDLFHDNDLF